MAHMPVGRTGESACVHVCGSLCAGVCVCGLEERAAGSLPNRAGRSRARSACRERVAGAMQNDLTMTLQCLSLCRCLCLSRCLCLGESLGVSLGVRLCSRLALPGSASPRAPLAAEAISAAPRRCPIVTDPIMSTGGRRRHFEATRATRATGSY